MAARKNFSTGQIINALRKAEVGIANGKAIKDVCRELGVTELPAHQLHGFAAGQTHLCLPQCSDDLLRSGSLPSHPDLLAEKLQTRSILTLHLVSFQGVRSRPIRQVSTTPSCGIGNPTAEEHVETVGTRLRGEGRRSFRLRQVAQDGPHLSVDRIK